MQKLLIYLFVIFILIIIFLGIFLPIIFNPMISSENFMNVCNLYIPFTMMPYYSTKKGSIFVSVASYRDSECHLTIESLFSQADHPEKVYVGICQQNKDGHPEEICLSDSVMKYINNINIKNMNYLEAKGPTYARYWCSTLWSGQEYYFQIDSHTKFEKGWDSFLLKMLGQCPTNAVLSAYPPTDDQVHQSGIPMIDEAKVNNGMPMFYAKIYPETDAPMKSGKPFVAAGYMCLRSDFLKTVPFDPMLSGLFQGEEVLFSARLFTTGYDVYVPNIKICSHHYARSGPMFYKDVPDNSGCRSDAEKKVKYLLGLIPKDQVPEEFLKDINYYGLGTKRTLDDFWKESGIKVDDLKS